MLCVFLGLLMQIDYYSMVFAFGFAGIIIANLLKEKKRQPFSKKLKKDFAIGAIVWLGSVVFAVIQILHGFNDRVTKQLSGNSRFPTQHIYDTLTRALSAFIPLPFFDAVAVWNHFIIEYFPIELRVLLFVLLVVLVLWLFRKQKDILLFFLLCGSVFIAFAHESIYGYARHQGHIYILFIFSLWMYYARESKPKDDKPEKMGRETSKSTGNTLSFIFILQILTSCIFYYKDIKYPFSNIDSMVNFVEANQLTDYCICGYIDYSISPLSAYTNKPVYMLQSKSDVYFIDWSKSKASLTMDEIYERVLEKLQNRDSLILILTTDIRNSEVGRLVNFDVEGQNKMMNMTLVGICDKACMVKDEVYYFYKVKRAEK